MGAITQGGFIVITTVALTPAMCYSHPNGKFSVLKFPAVLCGSREHWGMAVLGGVLLLFAISFYGYVIVTLLSAPRMQSKEGIQVFFRRTRFLVLFFRLDRCFWGAVTLLRSLCLSFVPVLSPDDPYFQQFMLVLIFSLYGVCMCEKWPWKVPAMNIVDAGVCFSLIVLLVLTGPFMNEAEEKTKNVFMTLLSLGIIMLYLVLGAIMVLCMLTVVVSGKMGNLPYPFLLRRPVNLDKLSVQFANAIGELNKITGSDPGALSRSMQDWQMYDQIIVANCLQVLESYGMIGKTRHQDRVVSARLAWSQNMFGSTLSVQASGGKPINMPKLHDSANTETGSDAHLMPLESSKSSVNMEKEECNETARL